MTEALCGHFNTTQRGASQGGFPLLSLFIIKLNVLVLPKKVSNKRSPGLKQTLLLANTQFLDPFIFQSKMRTKTQIDIRNVL